MYRLTLYWCLVVSAFAKFEETDKCGQPIYPGYGNCSIVRYAYDRLLGTCVPFQYRGCGRNRNNFWSYRDCDAACLGDFDYAVMVG